MLTALRGILCLDAVSTQLKPRAIKPSNAETQQLRLPRADGPDQRSAHFSAGDILGFADDTVQLHCRGKTLSTAHKQTGMAGSQ